jgi:hypothetical protein
MPFLQANDVSGSTIAEAMATFTDDNTTCNDEIPLETMDEDSKTQKWPKLGKLNNGFGFQRF